eukprot:2226596-Amphidinium_carterae.1
MVQPTCHLLRCISRPSQETDVACAAVETHLCRDVGTRQTQTGRHSKLVLFWGSSARAKFQWQAPPKKSSQQAPSCFVFGLA